MDTAQNLTIDDIDDILDEIEETEDKISLIQKEKLRETANDKIDLTNIESLDIELELMGLQQIPDDFNVNYDKKALLHGYFMINVSSYYHSLPYDLMDSIIDLCILFTFSCWDNNYDELIIIEDEEEEDDEETSLSTDDDNMFGLVQSPINLVTSPHSPFVYKPVNDNEFIKNPLKFIYPSFIEGCSIINNGHTVQINFPSDKLNECSLYINNKYFILKQFHFHTPSEHTIDNKKYEMEMHLVHINEKDNEIAVLGFIFSTNNETVKYVKKPSLQLTKSRMHLILKDDDKDESDYNDDHKDDGNDFLAQFWDQLPTHSDNEEWLLTNPISFDYLFETSSNNFSKNIKTNEIEIDMEIFEYTGSLTTPPYTEGVQWLVSKKIHFMNKKQLNKLSSCWNHKCNARNVQMYFGRTVSLRCKSSMNI